MVCIGGKNGFAERKDGHLPNVVVVYTTQKCVLVARRVGTSCARRDFCFLFVLFLTFHLFFDSGPWILDSWSSFVPGEIKYPIEWVAA